MGRKLNSDHCTYVVGGPDCSLSNSAARTNGPDSPTLSGPRQPPLSQPPAGADLQAQPCSPAGPRRQTQIRAFFLCRVAPGRVTGVPPAICSPLPPGGSRGLSFRGRLPSAGFDDGGWVRGLVPFSTASCRRSLHLVLPAASAHLPAAPPLQ